MNLVANNKNAAVTLVAGGVLGQLVLLVTSWLGVTVDAGAANWIAAAIGSAALWFGRNGIVGLWNVILHGWRPKP